MRLEVGKKYVRRDGIIVGPIEYNDSDHPAFNTHPYKYKSWSYKKDGRYLYGRNDESVLDLISEYIEPKQTGFVVGETYTCDNGNKVVCIHITDDKAYCAGVGFHGAAYTWSLDGEYLNALPEYREPYRITFAPKVEWVTHECYYAHRPVDFFKGHYHDTENLNITFPLIDGNPDWSQAKIEAV